MKDTYKIDPYQLRKYPLLVVISGPSGVGKDSVVQRLKERGADFHFVVTATSRPPRPEEVHGVDYFFVSEQEFEEMIADDELLEYAIVYEQYKGIPKQQIRLAMNSGKDVIMRLDVQGAMTIKRLVPEAILVFVSAASEEELVARLRQRRTDSEEQLRHRITTAKAEAERAAQFDYVVTNCDCRLDAAVTQILSIIRAEHSRTHPRQVNL